MKKYAVIMCGSLALSLSLAPWTGLAQFIGPEHITFVGAEATAAQTKPSVFAVQVARTNQNNSLVWTPVGSGFLLGRSNLSFGVTCDHVVTAAERIFAERGAVSTIFIGLDSKSNGYVRIPCKVIHRESSSDVAILSCQVQYTAEGKQLIEFTGLQVGEGVIGDDTSVVQGRGVLILGYPLGLGIEANQNHPIVRFGMVAQASEQNNFLIDGMASHGNSGSPVFSLTVPHTLFIDMVTAFKNESITLFDDTGQTAARLPYNSGLAVATKASVILKAVDEAAKKHSHSK